MNVYGALILFLFGVVVSLNLRSDIRRYRARARYALYIGDRKLLASQLGHVVGLCVLAVLPFVCSVIWYFVA